MRLYMTWAKSWRTLGFIVFSGALVLSLRAFDNQDRYTFGHPQAVAVAVRSLMLLIMGTHLFVWLLMMANKDRWLPTDEAMSRFIGVKAVFWGNYGIFYAPLDPGITLDSVVLFTLISLTTIDLDTKLFGRYVLGKEDEALAELSAKVVAEKEAKADRELEEVPT